MDSDPTPQVDRPAGEEEPTIHEVSLTWRNGHEARASIRADESILVGAERENIAVPVGCRTGACATCTGRLLEGRIDHLRPPRALKKRHLRDGYILTCIAAPRSDCRVEVGKDVQAELVENPWK